MKMKLLIATLVAASLWAGNVTVSAQETKTNQAPVAAAPRIRSDLDSLGLTAEQRAKAEPVVAAMRQQLNAVLTNPTMAPADKRVKVKEIRDAAAARLKAVLTPEQLAKWLKQNAGARPPGGTPRPTPPAPPAAPVTPKN